MHHMLSINGLRYVFILAVVFGLSFAGCGGSEEATQDGEGMTDAQPLGEEAPAEQNADADALTSFIGEAPAQEQAAQPPAQQQAPTQLGAYEKQIEDLRTENTSLKQRLVKLEQDNRTLNTMVAESETKIQSARERADSLEMAMMNRPAAQEMPAVVEQPAVNETEGTAPPMMTSSYEEAIKAFNERRYDDVIASLSAMAQGGISKDLEDNCHYWIGESYFAKRQYDAAIQSFETVLSYAVSEKKGDATYMIAQSHERKGNKSRAKEGYEKVVKDYPLSNVVKKAKERWAKL